MKRILQILPLLLLVAACNNDSSEQQDNTPEDKPYVKNLSYTVKSTLKHDTTTFTEGLFIHNGVMYESSGAPEEYPYAKSVFGTVDTATGKITVKGGLDSKKYFGEGITMLNGKLYQLTYKNQEGFVYDATTWKQIKTFKYNNIEGWGLTNDGKNIIMSDGTSTLTWLDPETLAPVKTINVTQNGYQRNFINELEYINGVIFANVWGTSDIVRINPENGEITGVWDMTGLLQQASNLHPQSTDMNGIAFDKNTGKTYVTGKLWPVMFEVDFGK